MNAPHAQPTNEPHIPVQAPFSWTVRWARAHRLDRTVAKPRAYRIDGSVTSDADLAAAVAFCEAHEATLELD